MTVLRDDATCTAWRLGRRPELDAVRGLAILLVVASHALAPHFMLGGAVGVAMFFSLSGFLITSLIVDEHHRTGSVRLADFYRRRVRRLLPALVVFLAVVLALGLATTTTLFASPHTIWPPLLYGENLARMAHWPAGSIGHTWSLSIEEQFYLTWPLLLVLTLRRTSIRTLLLVAVALAVLSLSTRFALLAGGAGDARLYYGTDTNAGLLLLGCAAALWRSGRGWAVPRPAPALLLLLAVAALGMLPSHRVEHAVVPPVAGLLTTCALLWLVAGRSSSVLGPRWLRHLGKRSYGLYLWHYPLLWVILPVLAIPHLLSVPLLVAASWGLTWLSWRYVEAPFQARAAAGVSTPSAEPSFTGVGPAQIGPSPAS
jgi:peptidoglycan/LPS O-acetylase OafA/YrhL